jgi:2-keto-4-pentenoate hydratase
MPRHSIDWHGIFCWNEDTEMSRIEEIASVLEQAERSRIALAPLSETYPGLTPKDAYAIQSALFDMKLAQGAQLVGRKIGLTSQAMQQQMGVDQPDYGFLLDTMTVPAGGVIVCSELIQPRIEPELAFWLAEDIRGPGIAVEHVLKATRGVSAALELVDSRISNWRITLVDTIADDASSGRMIVSESVIPAEKLDLAAVRTVLTRNGESVGTGTGAAVLGHPAIAVAWLANKLAEFDVSLLAGQVVLSGSMCGAVPVAPEDSFRAIFTEVGEVSISFK